MPLESCMILLDCSQYMRNGDYVPSRLEAQQDAANLLIGHTTNGHPESTVGVSANTNVLVSPTSDVGKIMRAVHDAQLNSTTNTSDVLTAVAVASLALKHRRNKNGQQRIVLFVGTPVQDDSKALQKAGKQLKKNNVILDVVCLGNLEHNESKLQELVDAANGRSEERTCHLVTVPVGVLPSDVLATSPIVSGGGAFAASAAAGAAGLEGDDRGIFAEFGGVDPNMDPELAMALRVSMEEERARQERLSAQQQQQQQQQQQSSESKADDTIMDTTTTENPPPELSEEEALLQQALAMSMNENDPEEEEEEAMADDEPMMHVEEEEQPDAAAAAMINDPAFVAQVLKDLGDNVDVNDPEIQELLKKAAEEKKNQK